MPSCSINQLPSELIAEILYRVIAQHADVYRDGIGTWAVYTSSFRLPYSWNSVKLVCRLWRSLLLKTPMLCDQIVLTRSDVVEDLLRRAGQLPVQVMSAPVAHKLNNENSLQAMETILSHFSRVSRADIAITTPVLALLRRQDVRAARETSLRHLLLNFYGLGYRDFDPSPRIFPDTTFLALETFCCIGGHVGICRGLFRSSLTSLSLWDLDFVLTPPQLSAYLAECPMLELLTVRNSLLWPLNGALKRLVEDGWIPEQTTSLPRLRTLQIDDSTDMALSLYFLHHIAFPASTSVRLQRRLLSASYDLSVLAAALRAKFERQSSFLGCPPVVRSVLVEEYDHFVRVAFWETDNATRASDFDASSAAQAPVLEIISLNDDLADALRFLSELPVAEVTHLRIRTAGDNSVVSWNLVLAAMPALQELDVCGSSLLGVLDALGDASRADRESPSVPKLRVLHLDVRGGSATDIVPLPEWTARFNKSLLYRTERCLVLDELRLFLPRNTERAQLDALVSDAIHKVATRVKILVGLV